MDALKSELQALLSKHGQQHVLRFYDELDAEGRRELREDVLSVDFDLLARLRDEGGFDFPADSAGDLTPAEVFPVHRSAEQEETARKARVRGEELLRRGAIACVTVAGGQASRLGHPGPKGTYPVGPLSQKSLFQWFAEKLLATRRRYGREIPWWIMTSEANDGDTRRFFEENDYFGLDPQAVGFFAQAMIPAVDLEGRLLLASRSRLFRNPNGHGGLILGMRSRGVLELFRERGIEQVFSFQVDNPLVAIADPLFMGLHDLAKADMSTKVVSKSSPEEKVGVVGRRQGRLTVIEYSDLPSSLRDARHEDGSLRFAAGNIAIHAFRLGFLEDLTSGSLELPYHQARKKMKVLGADGDPVEIEGTKYETFVFDALSFAGESVTQEVVREEEFSPVKNKEGSDSPETARRDLVALHRGWLKAAGISPPDGIVEISPLFALDGHEVERRAGELTPPNSGDWHITP